MPANTMDEKPSGKSTASRKRSVDELLYEMHGLRNKLYNCKQLERNTGDEHYQLMADALAAELQEKLRELQELQRP